MPASCECAHYRFSRLIDAMVRAHTYLIPRDGSQEEVATSITAEIRSLLERSLVVSVQPLPVQHTTRVANGLTNGMGVLAPFNVEIRWGHE